MKTGINKNKIKSKIFSVENDCVAFHDRLARDWSSGYHSKAFGKRLSLFVSLLSGFVVPGSIWLDAGCGSGVLTRKLAQLGACGLAVDASTKMLSAAEIEARDLSISAFEYRFVSTIEHLNLLDCTFDGILCSSVLEYLERPDDAISEFFRVLKPGGYLVLSVPNRVSALRALQKFIRIFASFFHWDIIRYLKFSKSKFKKSEIEKKLMLQGFVVVKTVVYDPIIPVFLFKIAAPSMLLVVVHKPDAQHGARN